MLCFLNLPQDAKATCPDFAIEGFGKNTVGGCGGMVYTVTNLSDSGAGSLRDLINRSGARIVKFGVSGTIRLNSALELSNPYVTVDGSDAPSPGIEITGDEIDIIAHDVIFRNLRFRGPLPSGRDNISIVANNGVIASNVVLDHVSTSGGMDGNIDISNSAHDVTVQWSILSDNNGSGLNLIAYNISNITMHHNLYAHSITRFPDIGGGDLDFVNNVLYNWDYYGRTLVDGYTNPTRANLVGNYFKPGVLSTQLPSFSREIRVQGCCTAFPITAYFNGNISPNRPNDTLPQDANIWIDNGGAYTTVSVTRINFPQVTTTSAFQAYSDVLANAGARFPCLDTTDNRVINDVRNGTGNRASSWPAIACSIVPGLLGDINGDRIVNSLDWSLMSAKWLTNDTNADLNKDGVVNSLDWSIMSSNWLKVI